MYQATGISPSRKGGVYVCFLFLVSIRCRYWANGSRCFFEGFHYCLVKLDLLLIGALHALDLSREPLIPWVDPAGRKAVLG